jgi:uncharacterized protein (TIGR03437 family)
MGQGFNRHARRIASLAVLLALPAVASPPTSTIAHLPNVQIKAAKVDASGNIYLAGQTTSSAAYISKLSPDGATTNFAVTLGGSVTSATALDIDSTGTVYIAGTTTDNNFPVTPGAAQSTGATAFAAKLDPQGNVVYAALIGGSAKMFPASIAVNSKRELVVSGQISTSQPPAGTALFILKLSADGSAIVAGPQGIGGLVITDSHDNIFVAGAAPSGSGMPLPTPGAFQGLPGTSSFCGCPFFGFPCDASGNQFVAALTPDLTQTRFLTYVTAKSGAAPVSIAVDPQGNILVAGATSSPDYPTTPDSYQPGYAAASGIVETCGPPIPLKFTSPTGYVTLVKSDGTGLIFSTFFSGTKSDTLGFAALTTSGIYIAGRAGSVDLPGFADAVPSLCLPLGFVTRMTLDGSAISSTRTPPGTPVAYDSTTGTLLLVSAGDLIRFDPSQPTPIACVLDAADLSPVTAIAPGQLLSVFGRFQYFVTNPLATTIRPVNGSFPVTSQGLGFVAGSTPAPLLYLSGQQINFQAPYEITGNSQTDLTLTYSDVNGRTISDSRTLRIALSNPAAFVYQPSNVTQSFPVALNADGTVNSGTNPAAAGSVVTVFLEGLGITNPQPVSGRVTTSPATPLDVPIVVIPDCTGGFCYPAPAFVSASSSPGAISGVTQVQLRAPDNPRPGVLFQSIFSLSANSIPLRDTNLLLWVK